MLVTDKGKGMLADHLGVAEDRMQAVKDGERIDLGGMTLEFIHFPWVHWPETMLTWLPERRVLFTCDLFGSHFATGDTFAVDEAAVLLAAKRYYAEIMMPFRGMIEKRFERVSSLDMAFIAPSHGPVYHHPRVILDAYRDWVSSPPRNMVVVPYVSMHASTRRMVEHFVEACAHRGIRAEQFNLAATDIGRLATLLVDAATIVIGTPTVLTGPHPQVSYAANLANLIRPKARLSVGHRFVRMGRENRGAACGDDPESQGGGPPAGALQRRSERGGFRSAGQARRRDRGEARGALAFRSRSGGGHGRDVLTSLLRRS